MKIIDEKGLLTNEGKELLKKVGKNTSCECPDHLVVLLENTENFMEYQKRCINERPQDEHIHQWLYASTANIQHIISSTIIALARLEGLINEKNEFVGQDEIK